MNLEVVSAKKVTLPVPGVERTADVMVITALNSPYGIIQDWICDVILETGRFFEEEEVGDIVKELEQGDIFVDVGANIGSFSAAAEAVGAYAIAIEPQPILQKTLKKNVKGEVHGLACGTVSENLPLFSEFMRHPKRGCIMANLGAASLTSSLGRKPTGVEVEVKSLDSIVGKRNPKVIKIDVEGMEPDVIYSGIEMIKRAKPVIYAEQNEGENIAKCWQLLYPLGYDITSIKNVNGTTIVRYAC